VFSSRAMSLEARSAPRRSDVGDPCHVRGSAVSSQSARVRTSVGGAGIPCVLDTTEGSPGLAPAACNLHERSISHAAMAGCSVRSGTSRRTGGRLTSTRCGESCPAAQRRASSPLVGPSHRSAALPGRLALQLRAGDEVTADRSVTDMREHCRA